MTRKYLPLLGIGLALASCQKDEVPAPVNKDFTVGYHFINQGDARVETVWMRANTFYPDKYGPGNNAMNIYSDTYPNITPNQRLSHIAATLDKTLYPGCITYLKVTIGFRTPGYTPFPVAVAPSGGYRIRVFELPPDTVTAAANCTRTFQWPSDTLKYPEVRWYN
ncbi:hypothetical protein MON38_05365 [Hymenobacter sp. DH14]|uniref:Uncharacterized protein n=1 Tax=Hymenobacter cyanobacteriorum TaxID=2926463 RepID=A0A9X1VCY8_9BACT|nr:hypothetical protein [Hymenobacter cyanobacteriorum]MCI1186839.1 hypothetical protein [Hymenobacter cyanobacteriorum]